MIKIGLISSADEAAIETVLRNSGQNLVTKLTVAQLLLPANETLDVDMFVLTRLDNNTNYSSQLITYLTRRKLPIIAAYVNYSNTNIGPASTTVLGMLGLASSVGDPNSRNGNTVMSNNPIMTKLTNLTVGSNFNAYSAGEYLTSIPSSAIAPGSEVLTVLPSSTEVQSAYFKKGMMTLTNTTLEMDVIFLGYLTSRGSLSATTVQIVHNALEYLYVKTYKVSGSVNSITNQPLQRNIYVYDQSSMGLIDKTRSDVNGLYTVHLRENTPVTVICNPESSDKNALISSNIIPVLREDL